MRGLFIGLRKKQIRRRSDRALSLEPPRRVAAMFSDNLFSRFNTGHCAQPMGYVAAQPAFPMHSTATVNNIAFQNDVQYNAQYFTAVNRLPMIYCAGITLPGPSFFSAALLFYAIRFTRSWQTSQQQTSQRQTFTANTYREIIVTCIVGNVHDHRCRCDSKSRDKWHMIDEATGARRRRRRRGRTAARGCYSETYGRLRALGANEDASHQKIDGYRRPWTLATSEESLLPVSWVTQDTGNTRTFDGEGMGCLSGEGMGCLSGELCVAGGGADGRE
ncbi:hypothetical protein EVAR_84131_1 [Eumeta japonica]|uniref:Uncharacterized protein n=1 Tax=Eumeta variegata TaxID=151549 RepID=A0A4C1UZ01_EUMVA|nr:hypothetical protein EVAR_84131_1 [Eumeta japonica]